MQHINRMMTTRSKYFNYFHVEEGKAACKNCDAVFPYSSRIGTNSIRNHIKNRHPEIFQSLDNWSQNQPQSIDENQNASEYSEFAELNDVKPNIHQLGSNEVTSSSNSAQKLPIQRAAKKRKSTVQQYPEYNNAFPFDLQAFLASNQETSSSDQPPANTINQSVSEPSDPLYPQDLLNVLAGNDDPVCSDVDQSMKHDVETIARNLSAVDDSLFYLKTTSEIIKKWPAPKVRIFVQNILKQAMEEDNKMRFSTE